MIWVIKVNAFPCSVNCWFATLSPRLFEMSVMPEKQPDVLDQEFVQAAHAALTGSAPKTPTQSLIESLLQREKVAQSQSNLKFEQFIGAWRLCFVTGTKKPHQHQNKTVGNGFYIPRWVKMQIVYSPGNPTDYGPQTSDTVGQIANQVHWAGLSLSLTGPARCWSKKNIMAFDFTRMEFKAFGRTLYQGFIRGGQEGEQTFWDGHVRTQAFFVYFLIQDQVLAARGRGGGIALWAKTET